MDKYIAYFVLLILLSISCIGNDYVDDEVEPILRLSNPIDSLAIDSSYQFEFMFLNNVGKSEEVEALWSSSNDQVISIDGNGLAIAKSEGSATISVEYEYGSFQLKDSNEIGVGAKTVIASKERSGTIKSTSSYKLTGDFVLKLEEGGDLSLIIADNYEATSALPGLYVYLSNNPSTTSGALEIQAVEVFKGAHTYTIKNVALNDYSYVLYFCKPFNVKVGDGVIN